MLEPPNILPALLARSDDPEAFAEFLAGRFRELLAMEAAAGRPWPVKIETFEGAQLATAGYGILVSDESVGIEVKLEILPGPRLEVDVTATRALSRPLVPLAKRAFDLLLRHLGGEPLGKVM